MPDPEGNQSADEPPERSPDADAYKDARKEEIPGDAEAFQSSDPDRQQASTLEAEGEQGPPEKQP